MSTTTTTPIVRVSMTTDGKRLVLGCTYPTPPAVLEHWHTLPNYRWDKVTGVLSCLATPAAAWRVIHERGAWAVKASSHVEQLAKTFKTDRVSDTTQPRMYTLRSWRHQAIAYNFAYHRTATMLAMAMGTGKTKVAVDLAVNWGSRLILVLCPKSVLGVWRREFDRWSPIPVDVLVLEKGTAAKKRDVAAGHLIMAEHVGRPAVVVINYDSAWIEPFGKWALTVPWDLVIADESHRIKSHDARVSKYAAKLGRVAQRRLCLTGTPMPHSPIDIFGQARFLDSGIYGDAWYAFKSRYTICGNPSIPQQVTGFKNQEDLQRRLAWFCYRVGAEVLDLPPVTHNVRPVRLSAKASKNYRELQSDLVTEVKSGTVTVANALVKLLRLQQVTSGFLQADEAEVPTEIDTAKADALEELLEDIGEEPVVVFCNFRHDLEAIERVTRKLGRRYGEVSGHRKDLTKHATMPDSVDVMGVQVRAGGLGIDLTRARYAIYFNHPWSLGDYDQSVARVHRPGQTRATIYYHLVAEGTVDEHVQIALEKKRDVVEEVLSVLKGGE